MKATARAAARLGVKTVVGFTGSKIWKTVAMFPPVPQSMVDDGYQDFADRWNPVLDVFDEVGVRFAHEAHPSEIAYHYWTTVAGPRRAGLRRPVDARARRLRRGRRALRPRGAPERDRLRLLDDGGGPGGRRPPPGVRAELGPEPRRLAGARARE